MTWCLIVASGRGLAVINFRSTKQDSCHCNPCDSQGSATLPKAVKLPNNLSNYFVNSVWLTPSVTVVNEQQ